eukprot:Phypoly_transcript_09930.p1 GENE.Phypoly_transcript_09930~~Phypoly_transcript_09930.p1  ORF type:complete len:368 (+),score=107.51 Phypoly_transcript_09930:234-1337(+)
MQRGAGTLARRAVLPQPLSATCLWRADEKRGGAKRKLKPYQRYKGKKGDLPALLSASNKWPYKWFKSYQELPEMVKREELYIPYYNDSLQYNPNDPAELKRYLNKKRAESLREKNESVQEHKGVEQKVWHPDQRLINNDEEMDDNIEAEEEDMDEEWEEDEFDAEWREREAPLRQAERKEYRAKRRANMIDETKKRILNFEKMSDSDKVKKLTEYRSMVREQYLRIKEMSERTLAMKQEEALEILKRDYGISPEEEERLLRNMERKPSEEEKMEFRKKYKMDEFKVPGELSGFDLFLKENGKEHLVGFIERIMSDEPPTLPPPVDLSLVQKGEEKGDEGDKKEPEAAAAPAPKAAPAAAKPDKKAKK